MNHFPLRKISLTRFYVNRHRPEPDYIGNFVINLCIFCFNKGACLVIVQLLKSSLPWFLLADTELAEVSLNVVCCKLMPLCISFASS